MFSISINTPKDLYFTDLSGRKPLVSDGYPSTSNLSLYTGALLVESVAGVAYTQSYIVSPSDNKSWVKLTHPSPENPLPDGIFKATYTVLDDQGNQYSQEEVHFAVLYGLREQGATEAADGESSKACFTFAKISAISGLIAQCKHDEAIETFNLKKDGC